MRTKTENIVGNIVKSLVIEFVRKIGLLPQMENMAARKFATAVTTSHVLAMIDTNTANHMLNATVHIFANLNGSFLILEDMVVRKLVAYVKNEMSLS